MSRNEVSTGIGLRHVRVAERDTDGTIKVPSGTAHNVAYSGLRIEGANALALAIPAPQRVSAQGDDRVYHTFTLPPTEVASGDLRVSKTNMNVIALISGVKVFESPTMRAVGFGTDKQGLEPAVVLWGCRQAIDSEGGSAYFGQQVWQTYYCPNAELNVQPASMENAAVGEVVYNVTCNDATKGHLGETFTTLLNGFTKAQYLMIVTLNHLMIDAFTGDAVHRAFTLSQTPSTGSVERCTVNGVINTAYTRVTTTVTFTTAPAASAKILFCYEYVATN